jgi:hypothetical protein
MTDDEFRETEALFREVEARYRQSAAETEYLRAARNRAVRTAITEGMPRVKIAKALGVTRARITQISKTT